MDSILTSIKKMLGISEEYEHFDADIIMHINSVFMGLTQLGVGPSEGYRISDENASWEDFITNEEMVEAVKTYTYMKVKLIFDPPTSGTAIDSYNSIISDFEWRINVMVDNVSNKG